MKIARHTGLVLVLGLVACVVALFLMHDAYPEASINMRITRAAATRLAADCASVTGIAPAGTFSSVLFGCDQQAATFLEYQLGVDKANDLMRSAVPVWHWVVHIYDDKQKFTAEVGVDGQIHSFERELDNDFHSPSISHEDARKLAMSVALQKTGALLSNWKLIDDSTKTLPGRVDHSFTWESQGGDYKGGSLRVETVVSGDKVSKIRRFLHIPDTFTNHFAWLRSQNDILSRISLFFVLLAALSMIPMFFRAWMRREISMRLLFVFAVTASLIVLLTQLNDLPYQFASHTVGYSITRFLGVKVMSALSMAFVVGIVASGFFATCEAVYRGYYPSKVALERMLSPAFFRANILFNECLMGAGMFGFMLCYSVLFYLIGRKLGLWIPLELNEPSIFSSVFPAWGAASIGIKASTLEEMGFRVFMLIVCQKLTRRFWLANFIQAAVWGFGHCNYAVEPPYARGVELTVVGLAFGWFMHRFGVLPLVLAHYGFDTFLGIVPLLCSASWLDKSSAVVSMAPLVVLPLIGYFAISRSGPVEDATMLNAALAKGTERPPAELVTSGLPRYSPLENRLAAILALCLICGCAFCLIPARLIGKLEPVLIDRNQAVEIARRYYTDQHVDLSGRASTAWLTVRTPTNELQYIYEQVGFYKMSDYLKISGPRMIWTVRWFKSGDPVEYSVDIGSDGSIVEPRISLSDLASGANLSESDAREMATNFVRTGGHTEVGAVDVSQHQRLARTDYHYSFEIPDLRVKEARYVETVDIDGDKIAGHGRHWLLPDRWQHAREIKWTRTSLIAIFSTIVGGLAVINLLYWVLHLLKSQVVNWKLVTLATACSAVLEIIRQVDAALVDAFNLYQPATPILTHLGSVGLRALAAVGLSAVAAAILTTILSACYSKFLGNDRIAEVAGKLKGALSSPRLWADSILIGATIAAACLSILHFGEFLRAIVSREVPLTPIDGIIGYEQWNVGLAIMRAAIARASLVALLALVCWQWIRFYNIQISHVLSLAAVLVVCIYGNAANVPDLLIHAATTVGLIVIGYLFITKMAQDNFLAYFFAGYLFELANVMGPLWIQERTIHPVETVVVGILFAAPLIFTMVYWLLHWNKSDTSVA